MCMIKSWPMEHLLARALLDFDLWLQSSDWKARENECVNQFAHAHLAKQITPGRVLFDFAQIGIEVAVPQLPALGRKAAVRKDLVVWSKPGMTAFDGDFRPVQAPIAIIEWKPRSNKLCAVNLDWLSQFTRAYPGCFGAVVTVDFKKSGSRLHTAAVRGGEVELDWIQGAKSRAEKTDK